MNDAAVTLPQVLLLSHVERSGGTSPTEVARAMHASLPAVSQMVDRLVQQGLLGRTEDPVDRRRKTVAVTSDARALLRKLGAARSAEYEVGLASLSPDLLDEVARLLERVLAELEPPAPAEGRPRARVRGGGRRGAER